MFPHSIRWRLNLWLGFLLVCVLSGFGVAVYQLQRTNRFQQIDEELERRVAVLSSTLRSGQTPGRPPFGRGPGGSGGPGFEDRGRRTPPTRERFGPPPDDGPGGPRDRFDPPPGGPRELRSFPRELKLSPEVAGLFDETRTNDFYFAAWASDGVLIRSSTNAPATVPTPVRLNRDRDTRIRTRTRGEWREAFHFTELGDCVLAGRSVSGDLAALDRFAFWLLAAGGTVLAFGLGIGWWLTTRAIRPVEEISLAANRISAGNLSERIKAGDADSELGRLAGVLNSTFARLDAAFAQQKQFTADASHELRTPLAVIISEAQTTLARERNAAEYRETVETCLDVAQQMRRLTESLLELARFDAGQKPIFCRPFDLAEETRTRLELIRPLARARDLQVHSDLAAAPMQGDAERLGQVITNLLTNAIHYNRDAGEIRVGTRSENGRAILTVSDTGPGIATEDLPHLFERFYRADKSRGRAQGRSGLGLAIAKAIVDSHGGTIDVSSPPGQGATFTVRLPAHQPEPTT